MEKKNIISKTEIFDKKAIRKILRISLTSKCNFSCFFCHNEGQFANNVEDRILNPNDLIKITKIAYDSGIKKFKITGGEPLLYKDVDNLIKKMVEIGQDDTDFEVSMVTNGSLLKDYAFKLKKAGLSRVNVSLVTLNNSLFKKYICPTTDNIPKIVEGIKEAVKVGLTPVKINFVLFYSNREHEGNIKEIPLIMEKCVEWGVSELRIYSLLWHNDFNEFENYYIYYDNDDVLSYLEKGFTGVLGVSTKEFQKIILPELKVFAKEPPNLLYPRTRKIFITEKLKVVFEPMRKGRFSDVPTCDKCPLKHLCQEGSYSLRILASGQIKGCLLKESNIDINEKLKGDFSDEELKKYFTEQVFYLLPEEESSDDILY
ncbi:MAG: radical SAM protein [Candidatus Heimdallarchaeaceae archaeon]